MSWEMFRCDIDCDVEPQHCINENLYMTMTDALVSGGFLAAGLCRAPGERFARGTRGPVTVFFFGSGPVARSSVRPTAQGYNGARAWCQAFLVVS